MKKARSKSVKKVVMKVEETKDENEIVTVKIEYMKAWQSIKGKALQLGALIKENFLTYSFEVDEVPIKERNLKVTLLRGD